MKHTKVTLVAALLAASLAARAQEQQKTSYDFSGWLVLQGMQDRGGFDSRELPRYVTTENVGTAANSINPEYNGYAVRQSRLRFAFNAPTDNFLGGATLKGLVEADFYGGAPNGNTNGTVDSVVPRLRHAYMAATWKDTANLTLLVGQTWGVALASPSGFAASLSHLAVPRFGGAGFLYRRAPQVRLSGDVPAGALNVYIAGAVLSPGDLASFQSGSPGGNQSTVPNFEGRIAAQYKQAGPVKAEVGLNAHYGSERWTTVPGTATALQKAVTASSQMYGLDAKIDIATVSLLGGLWQGQDLDNWNSIGGLAVAGTPASVNGVLIDATTNPAAPKAYEVKTQGVWGQVQWTAVKSLQVLLGAGFENPKDSTLALPGAAVANNMILRNTQYSAGLIWSVSSKWRVSLEATRYLTLVETATGGNTLGGNQFEIGSILAL